MLPLPQRAMNLLLLACLCCFCYLPTICDAFAPSTTRPLLSATVSSTTQLRAGLLDPTVSLVDSLSSSMNLLATIDSDIANIPTNEFRTVFIGGIVVMLGGLLSAVAVGVLLEVSDGYAAAVAESYDRADGDEDAAFWQNLSEEEKIKAQEMLEKVRQAKNNNKNNSNNKNGDETAPAKSVTTISSAAQEEQTASTVATAATTPSQGTAAKAKEATEKSTTSGGGVDMFSDY